MFMGIFKGSNRMSIKNQQYYDEYGMQRMKRYLDLLDESNDYQPYIYTGFDETDYRISRMYRESNAPIVPRFTREEVERYYGPNTYEGGLKTFIIEEGITKIGKYAFGYNLNLTEVHLPLTLQKIDKCAFFMCLKLKSIKIPRFVIKIGEDAFPTSLEEMYLFAENPPKISDIGISSNCKIFIPQNLMHLYFNNRKWKKYYKQMVPI